MTWYFAWVDPSETTFLPAHAREDEAVTELRLRQDEGNPAEATLEVENPRIGLLGPGRKRWLWIGYDAGDSAGPQGVFFGRLNGQPVELSGTTLRLEFHARPADYESRRSDAAEALKVAPFWDPAWFDPETRDDPDSVRQARAAAWHTDRTSHAVTLSDMIAGEDGTLLFGGGGERTLLKAPLESRPLNPPVSRVEVVATAQWTQAAAGEIDITRALIDAFRAAGTPHDHAITSYTGEGLERDWPEDDTPIGSGWRVGASRITRLDGGAYPVSAFRVSMPGIPGGSVRGTAGGDAQVDFPIWTFAPVFTVAYRAERDRTETVAFTLTADVQEVLTDPAGAATKRLELSSFSLQEPVDPGGSAGPTAPISDARRNSYFLTDRGKDSLAFLVAYARAELREQARAVEVAFETTLAEALDVTLRHSARVSHPDLPGGIATGKVISWEVTVFGDTGDTRASLRIGCTVGRDGSVAAAAGTPLYVEDGYVALGYQAYTGGTATLDGGTEVGWADFDDQGPPADGAADDGVDFVHLGPGAAILSLQVFNGQSAQEAELAKSYSSLAVAAEALNTVFTEVDLSLVPLQTGPFAHTIPVTVTALKVPKTIDLEAA